jgi:hypothetical protein
MTNSLLNNSNKKQAAGGDFVGATMFSFSRLANWHNVRRSAEPKRPQRLT